MTKGKLILKGKIELLSPALIGCGRDENSDMDVLKDSDGNPYIPATSFAGVLRHSIKLNDSYKDNLESFWGRIDENHSKIIQSSIIISDLIPDEGVKTVIRDGVKIDNKKGIAKEGAKFDYELIERGAKFNLNIEITLNGKDDEFKKRMLATIIERLKNEKIRIGAKTTSGFGRIRLTEYSVYEFDFSNKKDVYRWLAHDFSIPSKFSVESFPINKKKFKITAYFTIKNSLIVRTYTTDADMPDTVHIKSKGEPVLPGTSIKGAIRSRAERIINTLGKPEEISKNIINCLFGEVDEKSKKAQKGRVLIEETILEGYPEEVQTRIKIDRFTGGVMEGALLETMPLFAGRDKKRFRIEITVENYKHHEAGLMLLVLKDLWTGDLPIGGEKSIGRGVLEGKIAEIEWNNEKIVIEDISKLSDEERNKLQNFVNELVNSGGGQC